MEATPKRCQVVMNKIPFGEKEMNRCMVSVKRLDMDDKNTSRRSRGERILSPIQLQKLRVLLQKLQLSTHQGEVQLQKLRVLLRKLNVNNRPEMSTTVGRDVNKFEGIISRAKLQKFKVLLRKLKLNQSTLDGSVYDKEQTEKKLSRVQLQKFRVLLQKLNLSSDIPVGSFNVKKREWQGERKLSSIQLQKFRVLLRKLKLNKDRLDRSATESHRQEIVTHSHGLLPHASRQRFRGAAETTQTQQGRSRII